ncbi:MAG: hypothetical protein ACR2I0_06855 [Rhodoferax sp.]
MEGAKSRFEVKPPVEMADSAGNTYWVTRASRLVRGINGPVWSNWQFDKWLYFYGRNEVRPVDDGWYEIADSHVRICPVDATARAHA